MNSEFPVAKKSDSNRVYTVACSSIETFDEQHLFFSGVWQTTCPSQIRRACWDTPCGGSYQSQQFLSNVSLADGSGKMSMKVATIKFVVSWGVFYDHFHGKLRNHRNMFLLLGCPGSHGHGIPNTKWQCNLCWFHIGGWGWWGWCEDTVRTRCGHDVHDHD